jgi:hypothetical protein
MVITGREEARIRGLVTSIGRRLPRSSVQILVFLGVIPNPVE